MHEPRLPKPAEAAKAICLLVGSSTPAVLVVSCSTFARATGWLFLEICVAAALSLALSLSARIRVVTKYVQYVEILISRGLELVAALPVILSVAALTVVTPVPIPIAVALVIGFLSGLRFLRHAITATHAGPDRGTALAPLTRSAPAVVVSIPVIIEQLVSLEAAVAWLGPMEHPWSGGWGEQLGRHARQGALSGLGVWTLAAIGLSLALGVASCRFPVRRALRAVARTADTHP